MPDQLNDRRPRARTVSLFLLLVVGFLACGALAGWLWHVWWEAPRGVVADHRWYVLPGDPGRRADFDGTAKYVVVALAVGLLLGALAACVDNGREVAALAAVVVGSLVGGWVMAWLGAHLSPPDPAVLARTAADGTELRGHLRLTGWSPYTAMPIGALVGLVAVHLLLPRHFD